MKRIVVIALLLFIYYSNAQCWQKISAGGNNSMAIKTDGTLWATGQNNYGQVGIGGDSSNPAVLNFAQVSSPSQWIKVSCSFVYTLAIKEDGTLWAWGYNAGGALGDGTTINRYLPTQIGTDTWKFVYNHNSSFGIKTDGTLWGWGYGPLGNGLNTSSLTPVQIGTDTDWKDVCRNIGSTTLAIKTNGTLWGWGSNSQGELNDGTTITRYSPIQIGADTNWIEIEAGENHYIGLKTDGTLWSWGYNSEGELGNGSTTNNFTITQIGTDNDWVKLSSSPLTHCLAIKADGSLWGWGRNIAYEVGDGTNILRNSPVQVGTDRNWNDISAGGAFSIGLKTDNSMWVWGGNQMGQLGLGDTTTRYVPTLISNCDLNATDFEANNFIVYPNPATTVLTAQTDVPSIEKIIVMDMLGKKILEQKGDATTINVAALQGGLYILQILSEGKVYRNKFVKK